MIGYVSDILPRTVLDGAYINCAGPAGLLGVEGLVVGESLGWGFACEDDKRGQEKGSRGFVCDGRSDGLSFGVWIENNGI